MFDGYGNIKVLGGSTYRFSKENDCSAIALYSREIIGYSLNNRAIQKLYASYRDNKVVKWTPVGVLFSWDKFKFKNIYGIITD